MRRLLFACALLCADVAAAQPGLLASGEVSLQITAKATVTSPPDTITILVPVSSGAQTAVAARAANKAKIEHVKAALRARGIAPEMISMRPPTPQMGFIGNAVSDDGETALPPAALAAMSRKSAQSLMQIVLLRQEQVDRVREVLDTEDVAMFGVPIAALRDDGAARSSAVARAMEQARRDADAYASPLGLKVVRVARVANYGDLRATDWQASAALMQQMLTGGSSERQVETTANVWIDFVLAAR